MVLMVLAIAAFAVGLVQVFALRTLGSASILHVLLALHTPTWGIICDRLRNRGRSCAARFQLPPLGARKLLRRRTSDTEISQPRGFVLLYAVLRILLPIAAGFGDGDGLGLLIVFAVPRGQDACPHGMQLVLAAWPRGCRRRSAWESPSPSPKQSKRRWGEGYAGQRRERTNPSRLRCGSDLRPRLLPPKRLRARRRQHEVAQHNVDRDASSTITKNKRRGYEEREEQAKSKPSVRRAKDLDQADGERSDRQNHRRMKMSPTTRLNTKKRFSCSR